MNEDGTLSFGTAIDTSEYDKGIQHIEEKVLEVGKNVETESARISELLTNIPSVNIDVTNNASQSLQTIDAAFAEIDRVVDSNKAGIRELEAEYSRLGKLAKQAYDNNDNKELTVLENQRNAIIRVINARKAAINEAGKTSDELQKTENKLKEEAAAAEQAANAHTSLRTKIRELKAQMADMVANGVSQQSSAYKELANQLGNLTDLQGDIQQQGSVLANDEAKIAGVISGLNGLSGGFTAAQGAVGLFAGENEELNKIMLKVQSLMAITMGLQQVQQTLNKDSAFSLVTLNGLKKLWNKITGNSIEVQATETAITNANTTSKTANTVSQTANTLATDSDTVSQAANNASTAAGTVAQGANTVATNIQTGATVAGTVATRAMAIAMKGLKFALVATGIGAIVVALGTLVSWIMEALEASSKADKEFEENEKIMEDGRKKYVESSVEIQNYTKKINTFKGTKAQEKELIKELNGKYGEAMGYYNSLSQWKDVLKKKGADYCEMLLKEAEAQAILTKVTEAYINLQKVNDKAAAHGYDRGWYNPARWFGDSNKKRNDDAKKEAEVEYNKWKKQYDTIQSDNLDFKLTHDLGMHIDPSSGKSGKGSSTTFDAAKAALEAKKAQESFTEARKKYIKESEQAIVKAQIDAMQEGQAKEINQIALNTYNQKLSWQEKLKALAENLKESYKAIYMSQKGATETGWANSKNGKRSTEDYEKEVLETPQNKEDYFRGLTLIEEQGQQQMASVRKKYNNELIDQYGTTEQKMDKLTKVWMDKLAGMPQEYIAEAGRQMDEEFSQLEMEDFKKSLNWNSVFGNLDKVSTETLEKVKGKLEVMIKTMKGSPESMKTLVEAFDNVQSTISERKPFESMAKSFEELNTATKNQKEAQEAYNKALKEGTEEEEKNAQAKLDNAKSDKQKALSNATTALHNGVSQAKKYVEAGENLISIFETLGVEMPEWMNKYMSGIGETLDGLESMDLTKPMSVVNGSLKAIKGVLTQVISIGGLIPGLGGADYSDYYKLVGKYDALISIWDELIDKKKEYIETSYGDEVTKAGEEATTLQQKVIDSNYELARKLADSGASAGSHSIAGRINRDMSSYATELYKYTEQKGNYDDITNALLGSTPEQLETIKENMTTFWAELDGDFRTYLENIIAGKDKLEEIAEATKESLTNISFDSLYDSFMDSIMDMDSSAEDLADDVEGYLKNAVIKSMLGSSMKTALQSWYNDFAAKMEGGLTEDEKATLKSQYEQIAADALEQRDALKETIGLEDSSTREGTSKGIATASQDSVDENNARLTTIQGHTYSIMNGMQELNATSNMILERLTGIEDNTSKTNTKLDDMHVQVKTIKNTMDDIAMKGIKIKN